MRKYSVRRRSGSRAAAPTLAMIVGIVLVIGFERAGVLPAIPHGDGEWFRWGIYGGIGAVLGIIGYEGWRFVLK